MSGSSPIYNKNYYLDNRAVILAKMKVRYEKRRKEIQARNRLRYANLSTEKKKQRADQQKRNVLQRLYHLSEERYTEMLKNQNNMCACCGRLFGEIKESRPCVDHDHRCCNKATSCGKCIRSLLCRWCNRLIGILEKNPHLVQYLKENTKNGE